MPLPGNAALDSWEATAWPKREKLQKIKGKEKEQGRRDNDNGNDDDNDENDKKKQGNDATYTHCTLPYVSIEAYIDADIIWYANQRKLSSRELETYW